MNAEIAYSMKTKEATLFGIVHIPDKILAPGVLVIVGGPQTRVGSHRQFVLLARALASSGIPVMRFDYSGTGDSKGSTKNFEDVDEDIAAAIDQFYSMIPDMHGVVLWGLCDAASASLFYGYNDERVQGLVLLNPWVRSEARRARSYLKHYHLMRLFDKNYWQKLYRERFQFFQLIKYFFKKLLTVLKINQSVSLRKMAKHNRPLYTERMRSGLEQFEGRVLLILSGDDLTADEFRDMVRSSQEWRDTMKQKNITTMEIKQANHTFSSQLWRDMVNDWTRDWVLQKD